MPEPAGKKIPAQVVSAEEAEKVKQIIRNVFGVHANKMIAIASCESGFNRSNVNWNDAKITGNPSWGIFQLNRPQFLGWDDPETNVRLAKEMFDRRGVHPWSCARRLGLI